MNYNNDFICDLSRRISKTIMLPFAPPKGRTHALVQEYINKYTEEQIDYFLLKLATSKWVKNQFFSWRKLVLDDIIGTLLAGGQIEKEMISKYYNPKKLVIL